LEQIIDNVTTDKILPCKTDIYDDHNTAAPSSQYDESLESKDYRMTSQNEEYSQTGDLDRVEEEEEEEEQDDQVEINEKQERKLEGLSSFLNLEDSIDERSSQQELSDQQDSS